MSAIMLILIVTTLALFLADQNMAEATHDVSGGMLYPKESEAREMKELNGLWNFRADFSQNRSQGFSEKWFTRPLSRTGSVIPMPVPSSYNDITQDKQLRDFIGWVWYDREFYVPSSWVNKRVVLRLDSVRYYAVVWVNGIQVAEHEMGHLPFEGNLTGKVKYGGQNRITVAVNNTLTPTTLPPGRIQHKSGDGYPPNYVVQMLNFGFFNYAGIDRSVKLYTTPMTYIDDISLYTDVTTDDNSYTGTVGWVIKPVGPQTEKSKVSVEILDGIGNTVHIGSGLEQPKVRVHKAHPWWPYTIDPVNPGYMYTLKITLKAGDEADVYHMPFGFRAVTQSNNNLYINNKPFYCHGVGKHEDYDIRGKGLDYALVAKDFNLLKWLGVNCFRTSHYPYAEEIMDQADRQGFVVIDECPAVGLIEEENFNDRTLNLHKRAMKELIRRDKNRPSVFMWSLANEPASRLPKSGPYFKEVVTLTQQLDPYRLITVVSSNGDPSTDHVMQQVGVVCVNYYSGWYSDPGHTEVIPYQVSKLIKNLHLHYNKPVIITEYGAEALPGLHVSPSAMYSEEYQHDFLAAYHKTFDTLRGQYLTGEMVWNFADFLVDQHVNWPYGCHKGLFTRQRQPKYAAHIVRERYHTIINQTSTEQGHGNPK